MPEAGSYCVHVMSRVVNRDFVLGAAEKEAFRTLMRKLEGFTGLEILTYAILDNHFHILLHVPKREALSDEEIFTRLGFIHDRFEVAEIRERFERFKRFRHDGAYRAEREKILGRMYDLGEFMKALKQRFTRWFNKKHQRKGTLWEARYKSVLVEGRGNPLRAMAAYIDLNAVRAGICADPEAYRWCGYGEAVGGEKRARDGLRRIADLSGNSTDWRMVRRMYRKWLYVEGEASGSDENGQALKPGFFREKVVQVWAEDGELPLNQLLLCRVRYFSDGLAIGGKDFMEAFFTSFANRFGENRRKKGARMRGEGFDGLYSFRDLQLDVVG
ncbi:MAG: transposase [Verrucomicrobiota bacterium]